MTSDTGYFWFFNSSNVELVVKVLDARTLNNRFWVFFGALSNVEYTLRVTDTVTGNVKTYVNPSGRFASVGDTDAFSPSGVVTPSTPSLQSSDRSTSASPFTLAPMAEQTLAHQSLSIASDAAPAHPSSTALERTRTSA